jgi:hypothetical protein
MVRVALRGVDPATAWMTDPTESAAGLRPVVALAQGREELPDRARVPEVRRWLELVAADSAIRSSHLLVHFRVAGYTLRG